MHTHVQVPSALDSDEFPGLGRWLVRTLRRTRGECTAFGVVIGVPACCSSILSQHGALPYSDYLVPRSCCVASGRVRPQHINASMPVLVQGRAFAWLSAPSGNTSPHLNCGCSPAPPCGGAAIDRCRGRNGEPTCWNSGASAARCG
jgi:hypothetical protein